jgi:hypothetical protein
MGDVNRHGKRGQQCREATATWSDKYCRTETSDCADCWRRRFAPGCLDETSLPSLIGACYHKIFQIHAPIRTAMPSRMSMSGMTCGLGIAGP